MSEFGAGVSRGASSGPGSYTSSNGTSGSSTGSGTSSDACCARSCCIGMLEQTHEMTIMENYYDAGKDQIKKKKMN